MVRSDGRSTHGLLVRVFGGHEEVGWGHVHLPCTSSATCCSAVQMSGSVASLQILVRSAGRSTHGSLVRGMEKISCHAETIDAAWSAVKDFTPNSLCSKSKDLLLYVKCWQWRYVNLHTHLQQKTISTLKRLLWNLWKEKKPVNMPQWNESKTHKKANFAKFSRENLAQFGLQKCLFRYGKNDLF